ncbi:MAG: MFS transporter, partial [Mesorhizobium sp.]
NVGIALAASLGAAMLNAGYGYRSLPVVGAMAMLVAVAVALASHIWEWRRNTMPPLPAAAE